MVKFVQRSAVFSFFACIWLLITINTAYSRGREEPDLKKADKLIAKREYVVLNDSENSEEIIVLTSKLYNLENENKQIMINFAAGVQEAAQFNVYSNQLQTILISGIGIITSVILSQEGLPETNSIFTFLSDRETGGITFEHLDEGEYQIKPFNQRAVHLRSVYCRKRKR